MLAALWGVTPKHAHQLKLYACRRAADVVNLRASRGDCEGAMSYALPMEHALDGAMLCDDPKYAEALSDATEDVLQAEADRNPCEKTVRALARYRSHMRRCSIADDRRRLAEIGLTA